MADNPPLEQRKTPIRDPDELKHRRQQIFEMLIRGIDNKTIMAELEISRSQFYRELVKIRKENAKRFKEFNPDQVLAERFHILRQAEAWAYDRFHTANSENAKVGFLNSALGAGDKIIKLLQDAGVLQKMPFRVEESTVPDPGKLGDEELRAEVDRRRRDISRILQVIDGGRNRNSQT